MTSWFVASVGLAAGVNAAALDWRAIFTDADSGEPLWSLAALGVAVLLLAMLLRSGAVGRVVRGVLSWALPVAALTVGYAFRDDLVTFGTRVAAEIAPQSFAVPDVQTVGEHMVRITRRRDGHFIARTEMNGASLLMLVDTGASTVVLKPADAQKIGINLDKLRYTVPVQTANGTTYAAPYRLKQVQVGPIRFNEVDALIAKPGTLKDSLLGMSFLNRLRSYEFSGDVLTLRI